MQRRTRIWIGLGTSILAGGTTLHDTALARGEAGAESAPRQADAAARPRTLIAQAEAAGEGGPGEGGGQVLGTITEFRLSTTDPNAFNYDASAEVRAYAGIVAGNYAAAQAAAAALRDAVSALRQSPTTASLDAARKAWLDARAAYLRTEAYLFYAGPVDGPGGPFPRLNAWPVDPAMLDGMVADTSQALDFRSLARLNRIEPPIRITGGLHVVEYLLWGAGGDLSAEAFAGDAGARRGEFAGSVAQLLANDLSVVSAAWASGANNNYRASVEQMDQRNALGRAFNGIAVLIGYELPLRRIGAGLFPANENFQPSPFSKTSALDNRFTFEGARQVYFDAGLGRLVEATDAPLAKEISAGFERAEKALAALDAPYERFLAAPTGSPERASAEAAVRALTDLAMRIRQAGNRLGILVVIPGM